MRPLNWIEGPERRSSKNHTATGKEFVFKIVCRCDGTVYLLLARKNKDFFDIVGPDFKSFEEAAEFAESLRKAEE